MCENNGYTRLIIKGLIVVVAGLFAIFRPDILTFWFVHPVISPVRVYHILWVLTLLILIKRMVPKYNLKMSSGKVFGKNFLNTGRDNERIQGKFKIRKRRTDSGAFRSGLYWILLILVMWMWRFVGMLPDVWIYVIVIFFIFMDQFCISVFCPFQWLMQSKCCNVCRINNWGYLMAFLPLIFIPGFWTYSILFLSLLSVIQWEYLYFRHPERFYEIYNAHLMCKNCKTHCSKRSKEFN